MLRINIGSVVIAIHFFSRDDQCRASKRNPSGNLLPAVTDHTMDVSPDAAKVTAYSTPIVPSSSAVAAMSGAIVETSVVTCKDTKTEGA